MYSTQFISLFGYVLYIVHPPLPKQKGRGERASLLAAAYTLQKKRPKSASNTTVHKSNINSVF